MQVSSFCKFFRSFCKSFCRTCRLRFISERKGMLGRTHSTEERFTENAFSCCKIAVVVLFLSHKIGTNEGLVAIGLFYYCKRPLLLRPKNAFSCCKTTSSLCRMCSLVVVWVCVLSHWMYTHTSHVHVERERVCVCVCAPA